VKKAGRGSSRKKNVSHNRGHQRKGKKRPAELNSSWSGRHLWRFTTDSHKNGKEEERKENQRQKLAHGAKRSQTKEEDASGKGLLGSKAEGRGGVAYGGVLGHPENFQLSLAREEWK